MDRYRPAVSPRRPGAGSSSAVSLTTAAVPLVFLAVFFGYPLWALVRTGLAPDGSWDLDAARGVTTDGALWRVAWFTAWQAAVSTLLTLAVGLPGAWLFARVRFRGRELAWSALLLPFVLPTVVAGAAWLAVFGPDGIARVGPDLRGTVVAIVTVHVFFNVAVVIRVVGGHWMQLDPRVEDAARVLGASPGRVWWEVTLPFLRPALTTAAAVVYLFCFTSFGVVVVLGQGRVRTLEVEIWQRVRSLDLAVAATLSLGQVVALVALALLARRAATRTTGSHTVQFVAPSVTVRRPRNRCERLGATGVLIMLSMLMVTPLVVLVWRSLSTPTGLGPGFYQALRTTNRGTTAFIAPVDALRNSLMFAVLTALAATLLGTLTAVAVTLGRRGRVGRVLGPLLEAGVLLPLGTSAVTVGLGLYLAFSEPPMDLRGNPMLVPVAHTLVALPFVVRALLPVLEGLDPRPVAAARVLGARPVRAWAIAHGPVVRRSLVIAAGFAFAVSLGEFGATVFLSRADWPTVPVAITRLLARPGATSVGQAYALSVLLLGLTVASLLVLERARPRRSGTGAGR